MVHIWKHLKRTSDKWATSGATCSLGRAISPQIPKALWNQETGPPWEWLGMCAAFPARLLRNSSFKFTEVNSAGLAFCSLVPATHGGDEKPPPPPSWYFIEELFRANQAGWGQEVLVQHNWSRSWHSWHDTGVLHMPAWNYLCLSWMPARNKQTCAASQPSVPKSWAATSMHTSPSHRGPQMAHIQRLSRYLYTQKFRWESYCC